MEEATQLVAQMQCNGGAGQYKAHHPTTALAHTDPAWRDGLNFLLLADFFAVSWGCIRLHMLWRYTWGCKFRFQFTFSQRSENHLLTFQGAILGSASHNTKDAFGAMWTQTLGARTRCFRADQHVPSDSITHIMRVLTYRHSLHPGCRSHACEDPSHTLGHTWSLIWLCSIWLRTQVCRNFHVFFASYWQFFLFLSEYFKQYLTKATTFLNTKTLTKTEV